MSPRLLVLAVISLTAAPAAAEPLRASPFRGALVPAAAVAGDADATALEVNPGQLGLLDGAGVALVVDHWGDQVPLPGRGVGLLLGTPLFLGFTGGAGVQWLRPTLPGEPQDVGKLQLGLGWRLGRAVALGIGWDHLLGDVYGGAGSVTLGLGMRLHPALAAGLVVRDLGRPRPIDGGPRVAREWEGEVAVRPFATDRLEAALAV